MTAQWRDSYRSWGNAVAARHLVFRPHNTESARAALLARSNRPALGFGCGRSYGDVALNPDGALIDCRSLDRFLAFDPTTGVLECEAGVCLAEILAVLCHPDADGSGWMLPVTPGTRFITVAGAIANDVHGKNHHGLGTFGRHVLSLDLLRSDGQLLTCSIDANADLFAATIGGLGLTGLILQAKLQLRRVPGLAVEAEDIKFGCLDDFFALAAQSDATWDYTAAWIDCLATGANLGRGIYSRARHSAGRGAAPPARSPRLAIPITPPFSLATPLSVRAFNAVYWRKLGRNNRKRSVQSYAPVLYPLDAIKAWNRVYGPRGFFQFQSVVPEQVARDALSEILKQITASEQGSMLSVLKMFGALRSPGLLSFPMPGATLALDFPNRGQATQQLFERLERVVIEAGGRIYPAKDSLMSAAAFRTGYRNFGAFARHIDPGFSSAFARRVGLVPPAQHLMPS